MNGVLEFFSIVPWTIIFQYCNLLILCLLIRKFLFKPVQNILKARQEEIDGIYSAANEDRQKAAQLRADYDRHMAGAREEADQLIKSARENASRQGDAILSDAKNQAGSMLRRAENEIAQERLKAYVEIKSDLGGMAVDIARQMVGREISVRDQDQLVEDFIRNAGDKA